MKKLILTIEVNTNGEMFANTEQENVTRLEVLGMLEQVKHLILMQKPEIPSLSDILEEEEKEGNIVPLNP